MNSNYLKILVISLCLSSLLGVMACATGGGGGYGSSPLDAPSDPEYWKMLESSRGLG